MMRLNFKTIFLYLANLTVGVLLVLSLIFPDFGIFTETGLKWFALLELVAMMIFEYELLDY